MTLLVSTIRKRIKIMKMMIKEVMKMKLTDMEFVKNSTPPDFQAKNFTPSISPNFNSFSKESDGIFIPPNPAIRLQSKASKL